MSIHKDAHIDFLDAIDSFAELFGEAEVVEGGLELELVETDDDSFTFTVVESE